MFTTRTKEQMQQLLNGDPTEVVLQKRTFDGIMELTREQVTSVLNNVSNDAALVDDILKAARMAETDVNEADPYEMSDKLLEFRGLVHARIFAYTDADNFKLYSLFQYEIYCIIRDYFVHKYINK